MGYGYSILCGGFEVDTRFLHPVKPSEIKKGDVIKVTIPSLSHQDYRIISKVMPGVAAIGSCYDMGKRKFVGGGAIDYDDLRDWVLEKVDWRVAWRLKIHYNPIRKRLSWFIRTLPRRIDYNFYELKGWLSKRYRVCLVNLSRSLRQKRICKCF